MGVKFGTLFFKGVVFAMLSLGLVGNSWAELSFRPLDTVIHDYDNARACFAEEIVKLVDENASFKKIYCDATGCSVGGRQILLALFNNQDQVYEKARGKTCEFQSSEFRGLTKNLITASIDPIGEPSVQDQQHIIDLATAGFEGCIYSNGCNRPPVVRPLDPVTPPAPDSAAFDPTDLNPSNLVSDANAATPAEPVATTSSGCSLTTAASGGSLDCVLYVIGMFLGLGARRKKILRHALTLGVFLTLGLGSTAWAKAPDLDPNPRLDIPAPAKYQLSPENIDFGDRPLNSSAVQTLSFTNNTDSRLSELKVNLNIANGEFVQENNCQALAAGEACEINVTFRPSQSGIRTAALSIQFSREADLVAIPVLTGDATTSNTLTETLTASVSGNGLAADLPGEPSSTFGAGTSAQETTSGCSLSASQASASTQPLEVGLAIAFLAYSFMLRRWRIKQLGN